MGKEDAIEPGSFYEPSEAQNFPTPPEEEDQRELQAAPHEDLIAKYQVFQSETGSQPHTVYHPSSSTDCSPSIAFPQSRVIYAEIDERAVRALQEAGLEAHHASALEFNPGPVDLLILLNPAISSQFPGQFVVHGGYALVNDYHGTATELRSNEGYQLEGIIRPTPEGLILDRDHPEQYWEEVQTEEEWRNAPFTWGAANYEMAAQTVKLVTGKEENVMQEYKRLIEQAKEAQRASQERMIAQDPKLAELLRHEDDDMFMYTHKGRPLVLSSKLPSKKGTVDDLFVFRKQQPKPPTPTPQVTA